MLFLYCLQVFQPSEALKEGASQPLPLGFAGVRLLPSQRGLCLIIPKPPVLQTGAGLGARGGEKALLCKPFFLSSSLPPFWNVRRAPVTCQAVSLALGYSSADPHRGISVFSGLYREPLRDCPVPFLLQALTTQLLWLLNTDSVPTSHACTPPLSPTKPSAQRLMKTDTRESGDCAPCTHQSRLEAF